ALAASVDEPGAASTQRLSQWLETVEACLASGSPTTAERARAALAVVEAEADPATVRASPVLLRSRVHRLLPLASVPHVAAKDREGDEAADDERRVAAGAAREATALLLPEARPLLLDVVARSRDAAEIAGALAALSPEDRSGPDDATAAAIA